MADWNKIAGVFVLASSIIGLVLGVLAIIASLNLSAGSGGDCMVCGIAFIVGFIFVIVSIFFSFIGIKILQGKFWANKFMRAIFIFGIIGSLGMIIASFFGSLARLVYGLIFLGYSMVGLIIVLQSMKD